MIQLGSRVLVKLYAVITVTTKHKTILSLHTKENIIKLI